MYFDILHIFEQKAWEDNDFDVVKLVLFYYLHFGLLRVDDKKVIPKQVSQLSDDIDGINAYLQGSPNFDIIPSWDVSYPSPQNV